MFVNLIAPFSHCILVHLITLSGLIVYVVIHFLESENLMLLKYTYDSY